MKQISTLYAMLCSLFSPAYRSGVSVVRLFPNNDYYTRNFLKE